MLRIRAELVEAKFLNRKSCILHYRSVLMIYEKHTNASHLMPCPSIGPK
jgi:hypothetical protein